MPSAALIPPEIAAAQRASVLYDHPIALTATLNGENATRFADTRTLHAAGGIRHGVIGAISGAIVGGALGYAWVGMHCDNGISCNATRPVLTGAAIGAVIGMIVEYGIRSWPETGSK